MFKNYIRMAWRSLLRGKGFSLINISGLVVGMAGAGLILLWLVHEVSYDRWHEKGDRIAQIWVMTDIPGLKHDQIPVTTQPVGPALKAEFPDVEDAARLNHVTGFLLRAKDESFTNIRGGIVDPSFLRIFSFPLVQGNLTDQLNDAHSIVITEKLAQRLFGTRDAMGKTLLVDSADHFKVTGVLKDLPTNTDFHFEYLLSWRYLEKKGWATNDFFSSNYIYTYVLLKPGVDLTAFNAKIRNLTRVKTGKKDIWLHFAYPISRWHLYGSFENGVPVGGRIDTVRMFGLIAGFILLIACINFMNLSTARSEKRAKEVGIRKVVGAARALLIGQFIVEAFLIACLAGGLALLAVMLLLPAFNTLIGENLSMPWREWRFWMSAAGFILFTSLLAGSYPAFYLSSFKPVSIFRKQFRKAQAVFSPRRVLVVLQFCFAVVLIISTLIVRDQLRYLENRDLGYNNNNLIYVNMQGEIGKNYPLIRRELLESGAAVAVTKTWAPMTWGGGHSWSFRWAGMAPGDTNTTINVFSEDAGLVKTMGMHLVAGRDIDVYQYPTDSLAVVLNETAVKTMRFANPIGQVLREPYNGTTWHVVGVVKNYIDATPWEETPPVVIKGAASDFRAVHVRFNPGITTKQGLAKAEHIFKKYNPTYPFVYTFVDKDYAVNFEDSQRTGEMVGLFAGLAIFISCLGLLGLSAYVAESRVKEIGVRKVLGASVAGIARLLSMEFVRLVLISLVIAVPVAWYAMSRWLGDYSYRIRIGWGVFALAGVLAVAIALVTVSWQAVRAARANPVRSLRSE